MNKRIYWLFLLILISLVSIHCKKLTSFSDRGLTITINNEKLFLKLISLCNKFGDIIYVDTPIISISSRDSIILNSTKAGGIIGVKQSDGRYPVIDFKKARNAGSTQSGFIISGSNQYIKYLVIENAGDNGIWITGTNNIIDHVITRYNNNAGILLSKNANSNTLNYCYSYRNCDVPTKGQNADGFAIKLGANNTIFSYCFSWDNANNGWDSFDKRGDNSAIVTYKNSACWNNGNPDIFSGKYDYDNNKALDKKMWTIQQIMASDPNYENNYNKRNFSINNAKINGMNALDWINEADSYMNGNGFNFGFNTIVQSLDYCIAFDHKSRGFFNNDSPKRVGYFKNSISFNNYINYQLHYIFKEWKNMYTWNPKKLHQYQQSEILEYILNEHLYTKKIYDIREQIVKNCQANKFDDSINFDNIIKNIKY